MPCLQLRYLLLIAGLTCLLLSWAADVQASARSLPPAAVEGPQYSTPPIRIQAPPQPAEKRKNRITEVESAPLAQKNLNVFSSSDVGAFTCPPDSPKPPNQNGATAVNPLERLRATASGTVLPENRQLPIARQQRLQANAAWQMGLLSLHGICVVLNTAEAAVWFERAHQLGEPLATAGLAWCEIEGCRAAANPAAASKWIDLLSSVDAPRALYLRWLMQSRLAPLAPAPSGLDLTGNYNNVFQNAVAHNGYISGPIYIGSGMSINGNSNRLTSNYLTSQIGNGITVKGIGNTISSNTVRFSGVAAGGFDMVNYSGSNHWNANNTCNTQNGNIPVGVCKAGE